MLSLLSGLTALPDLRGATAEQIFGGSATGCGLLAGFALGTVAFMAGIGTGGFGAALVLSTGVHVGAALCLTP